MSITRIGAPAPERAGLALERVQDAARTTFIAAAIVACAAAASFSMWAHALHGAGRTLFGIGFALLNVSLVCAAACLSPGRTLGSLLGRGRWLAAAFVALVLGVVLSALAPVLSLAR